MNNEFTSDASIYINGFPVNTTTKSIRISDYDVLILHISDESYDTINNEQNKPLYPVFKGYLSSNGYLNIDDKHKRVVYRTPALNENLDFKYQVNSTSSYKISSNYNYLVYVKSLFKSLTEQFSGKKSCDISGNENNDKYNINMNEVFSQQKVYLFSLERGYLMLLPEYRDKHKLNSIDITLSKTNKCFGTPLSSWFIHNFVGYDTVVMNWAISGFDGRGYLYNAYSKELFNLNYAKDFFSHSSTFGDIKKIAAFKIGLIATSLFIFFTCTTLVSFVLRETQERMLKFTFLLQHHISHQIPYGLLVVTHVVESLVFVPIVVGILFFLFEFFADQLLAFMVLSLVWMSEVYSVISLRTMPSVRYFPTIFLYYFVLFHIYFFSYPYGFSYLALFTTVLFLQHAMIHFWNKYEVPAFEQGHINAMTPRVGMETLISVMENSSNSNSSMRSRANSNESDDRSSGRTSPRRRTASANDAEVDVNQGRILPRSAGTTPDRNSSRIIRNLELFNQYTQESRSNNAPSDSQRPITFTVSQPQPKFIQQPRPRGSSHNSSNTWQSRTLEFAQTYQGHPENINFQGTDMMSHVELSKKIQQQQMHAAFRHLGFSVAARRNNSDQSDTSTLSYTSLDNLNNLGQEIRPNSRPSSRSNSNDNSSIIGDSFSLFSSAVNVIGSGFGLISSNNSNEMSREVMTSNKGRLNNIPSNNILGSDYTLGEIDIEDDFSPVSPPVALNDKRNRSISLLSTTDGSDDASSNQPKLSRADGSKSSINDFGYRKNSFHIFGNQFDE